MVGPPCCGKSTIINSLLSKFPGLVVASGDKHFMDENGNYTFNPNQIQLAHRHCRNDAVDGLLSGKQVIVDNTSTTSSERLPYRKMAQVLGVEILVVSCLPSIATKEEKKELLETLKARNQRRSSEPSGKTIPVKTITRHLDNCLKCDLEDTACKSLTSGVKQHNGHIHISYKSPELEDMIEKFSPKEQHTIPSQLQLIVRQGGEHHITLVRPDEFKKLNSSGKKKNEVIAAFKNVDWSMLKFSSRKI